MVKYQVVKNPRWNWNIQGEWLVVDSITGTIAHGLGFEMKEDAEITCHAMNVIEPLL